jgi:hypothetical protein
MHQEKSGSPAFPDDTKKKYFRLRKDLRRTKALLKDAQSAVERSKAESSSKVVLRQLKNQVRTSAKLDRFEKERAGAT